jgi:uncharacterized SAM-binding protein YcdF (DUF218 family)
MFFVLKNFFSLFLFPVPLLCLGLLGTTIFLLIKKKRRRYAWFTGGLLIFLYWTGSPFMASWLTQPLQNAYPPWRPNDGEAKIEWVFVLGGGDGFDCNSFDLAYSGRMGGEELVRMAEGVRIKKLVPEAKYYTTVFSESHIELVKLVINKNFGIAPEEVNPIYGPRDTRSERVAIKKIVEDKPGVVVSSAFHLPRIRRECGYAGLKAEVSPGPRVFWGRTLHFNDFVPSSEAMAVNRRAIKEYAGIIWGNVRNWLFD